MRRQFGSVEMLVRPVAERGADWIDRQTHSLRDRFNAIEDGIEAVAGTRKEEPVPLTRAPGAVSGPARVVDGDTLDVGGVRVRLHGIDAPESAQRCRAGGQYWSCGREATRALAGRFRGNPVACDERDRDSYGRIVPVCRIAGSDRNAWMVTEGWPFAYAHAPRRSRSNLSVDPIGSMRPGLLSGS